jgi:hypothetical protein
MRSIARAAPGSTEPSAVQQQDFRLWASARASAVRRSSPPERRPSGPHRQMVHTHAVFASATAAGRRGPSGGKEAEASIAPGGDAFGTVPAGAVIRWAGPGIRYGG